MNVRRCWTEMAPDCPIVGASVGRGCHGNQLRGDAWAGSPSLRCSVVHATLLQDGLQAAQSVVHAGFYCSLGNSENVGGPLDGTV